MPTRSWIIYTRVSTEEQAREGISLAAQRDALRGMLAAKGVPCVQHLEDAGLSAATLKRPALQLLLDQVDAGQVAGVAVWKLDRLTRSLRDLLDLTERFAAADCELFSMQEAIDTTGPMGRFQLSLLGALAQFEREQIGQRVKAARDYLVGQGNWVGGPCPAGCRVVGPPGARVLERDPKDAPLVEPIWRMSLDGAGLAEIADYLAAAGISTNRGLPRWTKTSVRGLLTRQAVIGILVDRDTWEQVARTMTARRGRLAGTGAGPASERAWPLRGIARCGSCGSLLTSATGGRSRAYLRCSGRNTRGPEYCSQRDLPAAAYEAAVVQALVQELTQRGDLIQRMTEDLLTELRQAVDAEPERETRTRELTLQRDQLQARIDTWLELAADTGAAGARQVQTRIQTAGEQIDALEAELALLAGQRRAAEMTLSQAEAAAQSLRAGIHALPSASPEIQASILPGILHSATIHAGRSIDLELALLPKTNRANPAREVSPGSIMRCKWLAY